MSKVWFSSDFHFDHSNLVSNVSKWVDKSACRNFDSVWHHNKTLLENINRVVMEDDILYFLGDFSFNGHINIKKYRNLINCKTIYCIAGNHDKNLLKHKEYIELFTSVGLSNTVYIEDYTVLISHRAINNWNICSKDNDKYIHLYGHSHGNYQEVGLSMDVGVDTHPEFRPYSFDEIKEFIEKRKLILNYDK
jgi:calcineurin-like phosphoesterase family protein